MKHLFFLLLFASFCMGIWLAEILLRDWRGLEWLNYFNYTTIIIPFFVLSWIVWVNGKIQLVKHLFGYPILFLILLFCTSISLWILIAEQVGGQNSIFSYSDSPITHLFKVVILIGIITTFPLAFLGVNFKIAKMEKKKLSKMNKWVLFFSSLIIFPMSAFVTMLLFTQSYLFPLTPPDPYINGLEIIHWVKSGSIIFAYIVYEGIFYLWIKEKVHLPTLF